MFVGDIRGCKESMNLILIHYDNFKRIHNDAHIIFLGDYVGGPNSLYCLTEILKLKISNPERVHLCRGNHEDVNMWRIDEPKNMSVLPDLKHIYSPSKTNRIYSLVGQFYSTLNPVVIINNIILCCHGMITNDIQRGQKFNITPNIIGNNPLECITWRNYPMPAAEDREYGKQCHDLTPEELKIKCDELGVKYVIKGHDYSGAGNVLNGSGINLHIIISSLWKAKKTETFFKYNDDGTINKSPRHMYPNLYKHITGYLTMEENDDVMLRYHNLITGMETNI